MTIYDVCLYNGENHLFDLRHRILSSVVDEFIVVEGTHTFQGRPKHTRFPLLDYSNVQYSAYELPDRLQGHPWEAEAAHRRYLGQFLLEVAKSDRSIFMLSDIDEIANPNTVLAYANLCKHYQHTPTWILSQYFSYYYANLRSDVPWLGTRISTVDKLYNVFKSDLQEVRKCLPSGRATVQENAGWHFSYMMSVPEIQRKLRSFAHTEYSGSAYTSAAAINQAIATRSDLFERPITWNIVPIDDTFPAELHAWAQKYPGFILSEEEHDH